MEMFVCFELPENGLLPVKYFIAPFLFEPASGFPNYSLEGNFRPALQLKYRVCRSLRYACTAGRSTLVNGCDYTAKLF